jgi:NADPH:quinone reductase-like Zn-dependent oxidoreductase
MDGTMRALAYERYGPPEVQAVRQLPIPRPGRGEVLVRVRAAGLNPKDVLVRKGKFKRIGAAPFPRVCGYDFAGEVAALGPGAAGVRVGEAVYGMLNRWAAGAAAEFVAVPMGELAPMPALGEGQDAFERAAAVPLAALTALQALRDCLRLAPGARVLINGASGGVGTFAVQLARLFGASGVSTSSAQNRALCRELGAQEALDYAVDDLAAAGPFDAVFDVFGSLPAPRARPLLRAGGRYVTAIPSARSVVQDILTRWSRRPARLVVVRSRRRDLEALTGWLVQGELRPVVDRIYPLEAGPEAHRYVETKRARGKVVLRVSDAPGVCDPM